MRVLIVGTGAEAAWVGSRLISAGVGVSFLTTLQRVNELNRHGMVIRAPGDIFQGRVHAITSKEIVPPYDAVLIGTRAHNASIALAAAHTAISPNTVLLPLRFDPIRIELLAETGPGILIAGVPSLLGMQRRDGSVSHAGQRTSISIDACADPAGIKIVHKLFGNCDIEIVASSDIRSEAWVIFTSSAASAALQILHPLGSGVHWQQSRREAAFRELVHEALRIGVAAGLKPVGARAVPTQFHDNTLSPGAHLESLHNMMVAVRLSQDCGVSAPLFMRAYKGQFDSNPLRP